MRILKSRRAISGAVTALILVIVSVALALAVAVFAFGLFGSFGNTNAGVQIIGTPTVAVINKTVTIGGRPTNASNITITLTMKNSGSAPAAINSVTVGNLTFTPGGRNVTITPSSLPSGFDGSVTIKVINYIGPLPGSLANTNVGGTVPVSITVSEGSLTPTLSVQASLQSSNYTVQTK